MFDEKGEELDERFSEDKFGSRLYLVAPLDFWFV